MDHLFIDATIVNPDYFNPSLQVSATIIPAIFPMPFHVSATIIPNVEDKYNDAIQKPTAVIS